MKGLHGKKADMSIRIEADIHTHTIASGHAYGTIREMMPNRN